MPEGHTLRARRAPSRAAGGRDRARREHRPARRCGRASARRRDARRSERPRQAPPVAARGRQDAALAPADARLVARVPDGRALVEAGAAGLARAAHARRSSRCSSTARCSSSCARAASRCIRCWRGSAPTCSIPRSIPRTRRGARSPPPRIARSPSCCSTSGSPAAWATSRRARRSGRAAPTRSRSPEAVGLERLAEIYDAGRVWLTAGVQGGGDAPRRIYGRPACPRCGTRSARRAQGDDGRTTWWCPSCQSG